MKAAILVESNKPLVVGDIDIPSSLEFGQVLVKVHYSGICGAQINEIEALKGPDKFLPHLLGHEGSGIVEKIGNGVKNVKPGDKVVIVSENRPEWIIADLAITLIGAITVPAYTTNTEDDHHYILEHSDAKAVIASNNILANRVALATTRTKLCKILITLDNYSGFEPDNLKIINFNEVSDFGKNNIETSLDYLDQIQPDDVSCIIYTSGTGGRPKGVMLTHRNIYSNLHGAEDLLEIIGKKDNKYLSLIPLSHSYEHTAGLYLQIDLGSENKKSIN